MPRIHRTPFFLIYFGNTQDNIKKAVHCVASSMPLSLNEHFKPVVNELELAHVAFLNQTHRIRGTVVDSLIPAFTHEGDFLITVHKQIGIGVMTADCLPIAFYDKKNKVAAIAHAGWRGTVAGIAQETVIRMGKEYGTQAAHLEVFFGPSARSCCYQVDDAFVKNLKMEYQDRIIAFRKGQAYFDMPGLNILQLQELGISVQAISTAYNFCTICDHRFFSHRRQAENAGRQMTVIVLK